MEPTMLQSDSIACSQTILGSALRDTLDAGYEEAEKTAREKEIKIPMLENS
jgi:hypothetical protein